MEHFVQNMKLLLHKEVRRTTILLWIVWFGMCVCANTDLSLPFLLTGDDWGWQQCLWHNSENHFDSDSNGNINSDDSNSDSDSEADGDSDSDGGDSAVISQWELTVYTPRMRAGIAYGSYGTIVFFPTYFEIKGFSAGTDCLVLL